MGTNIRNSISPKNPYYLSKHRMLELKHFCMQYEEWRQEYVKLTVLQSYGLGRIHGSDRPDPTSNAAIKAKDLDGRMKLIAGLCMRAGGDIWEWLFKGVTCGLSYADMTGQGIPCGRDYYYERYRKFFWLLDKER